MNYLCMVISNQRLMWWGQGCSANFITFQVTVYYEILHASWLCLRESICETIVHGVMPNLSKPRCYLVVTIKVWSRLPFRDHYTNSCGNMTLLYIYFFLNISWPSTRITGPHSTNVGRVCTHLGAFTFWYQNTTMTISYFVMSNLFVFVFVLFLFVCLIDFCFLFLFNIT